MTNQATITLYMFTRRDTLLCAVLQSTKEKYLHPLESLDRNTPIIITTNRIKNFQEIAEDLLKLKFNVIMTDLSWPSLPVVYDEEDIKEFLECLKKKEKQIRQTPDLLADEESVKVFDNILKYKMTSKKELLWEICTNLEKQYFPEEEIFSPSTEEVFIDAGCLNAGTIEGLKRWTSDTYAKVYAFEPSSRDKVVCDE